ncbi:MULTISPECIES: Swt1 family HEPN domain-containing protein [Vibrio]|uniref:Swt1 family HEPN domain-containing protein n=1 Tax=Vibrio TaxID=662 RepID=UPI00215D0BBB|nr:Swt1 family HEPN domain-containing protein [Vibrio alginolyticus]MCR9506763.1 Swt1 family HEPN domain-containing protein [Vibrio alginolyticus]
MDWREQELLNVEKNDYEDPQYNIPGDWIHIHSYEALNILFRFENSLRVFVYSILKKHKGANWANTNINKEETIFSAYKQRSAQYKKYGYLGITVSSPMLFLNSGELVYILENEGTWKQFSPYFSADRMVIVNKLLEINAIRNSFAHFRPVTEDDVTLLKQNISHVFHGASEYFKDLYTLINPVPTNLNEKWYIELNRMNYNFSSISFLQSNSSSFIDISVTVPLVEISQKHFGQTTPVVETIKINIDKFFKSKKKLLENVIYVTDSYHVSGSGIGQDTLLSPNSGYTFSFTFHRANLNNNVDEILEHFLKMFQEIDHEMQLILNDPKASGSYVSGTTYYGSIKESKRVFSKQEHKKPNEVVEYWGEKTFSIGDDIVTRSHMPWIEGSICPVNSNF